MTQKVAPTMKFLDPDDPFFRRTWVRWATVTVPVVWGLLEYFWIGSPFWALLMFALAAYAGWMLFIKRRDS